MKIYSVKVLCLLAMSMQLHAQSLLHAEMLARPTDRSVLIHCIPDQDLEWSVRYSEDTLLGTSTAWQRATARSSARIELSNLLADKEYYYTIALRAIGSDKVSLGKRRSFHTARKPGSEFRFVVQADPHLDENSDSTLYRRCLQNQLEDGPDFMIDLGDFLMSDKLKNTANKITRDTIEQRCHLFRRFYEQSTHSVPLMIALGNHEGEAGWNLNGNAENVAIWNTQLRQLYFPNPKPTDSSNFFCGDTTSHQYVGRRENYYAWQWGDALFIVLDPYWYTPQKPDSLHGWRWTLGRQQYDWLRTTLEKTTATFKFVFAHQLIGGDANGRGGVEFARLYEWGGKNLDGSDGFAANRPGWYKPIRELLQEHRVNVFFHGHDHFFGQQQKDCLIYQECPQPSLPNFQSANQAEDYGYHEGTILPNAGHLRVTVRPEEFVVEYVRAYLPTQENGTRHNKDISARYSIKRTNCYDSLVSSVPIVWNAEYADELVYPNPASNTTQLSFTLQQAERVDLAIYDAQGRVVRRVLRDFESEAGRFLVQWDCMDDMGLQVSNGSYHAVLSSARGVLLRSSFVVDR